MKEVDKQTNKETNKKISFKLYSLFGRKQSVEKRITVVRGGGRGPGVSDQGSTKTSPHSPLPESPVHASFLVYFSITAPATLSSNYLLTHPSALLEHELRVV